MRKYLLTCVFLMSLFVGKINAHADVYEFYSDLDLDGTPDKGKVIKTYDDLLETTNINLKIEFSSGATTVNVNFRMPFTDHPYGVDSWQGKPGYLIVYSGQNEYANAIYKWNAEQRKMCLFTSSFGINIPYPEILKHWTESDRFVMVYDKCVALDAGIPEVDHNHYKNNTIQMQITMEKAELFNMPEESSKAGMYLVKGDIVTLKEYKYRLNKQGIPINWFRVEYFSKQLGHKIVKWLKSTSMDLP